MGLRGCCEASEQKSNIVYGFHLIPIYNRAQFVDKTDPCYSTSRRQRRYGQVPLWNAIWNAIRISPWHPFSGPCWRCTCLPVLTLEMQGPGDAVTSILPAGIRLGRESASLVRAVKSRPQGNPTPGLWRALSLSAMVLCSVQMGKRGQIYPLSDQRVCHRRRWWPSHAAMPYYC